MNFKQLGLLSFVLFSVFALRGSNEFEQWRNFLSEEGQETGRPVDRIIGELLRKAEEKKKRREANREPINDAKKSYQRRIKQEGRRKFKRSFKGKGSRRW